MQGDEVIEHGVIIIENRRIVAVGDMETTLIPDDAEQIDLDGATVVPGYGYPCFTLARPVCYIEIRNGVMQRI